MILFHKAISSKSRSKWGTRRYNSRAFSKRNEYSSNNEEMNSIPHCHYILYFTCQSINFTGSPHSVISNTEYMTI